MPLIWTDDPVSLPAPYIGRHRAPRGSRRPRVAHSELRVLTASCTALLRFHAEGRSAEDAKALAHMEAVDMRLAMEVAR